MAVDDFYTVAAGGLLAEQVTTNDTTCQFAVVVFDEPDHAQGFGFVFDQSSGGFLYEPEPGFVGTDSFVYGIGVVDPEFATVTIDVTGPPAPTTITPTTTPSTSEPDTTTMSPIPTATPPPTGPTPTTVAPTTPPRPVTPPTTGASGRLPATR